MYKLIKSVLDGRDCAVTIIGKNISIPFDPANTDYIAYLKWIEEGNTVLPAEENQ
jgi:hypothetical protein